MSFALLGLAVAIGWNVPVITARMDDRLNRDAGDGSFNL